MVGQRFDKTRIVALYQQGLTRAEVATELGCSIGTVDYRLNEVGIRGPRGNGPRDAEIVRRYLSGESLSQVGAATGMTKTAVHQVLRRLGVPRRPKGPHHPRLMLSSGGRRIQQPLSSNERTGPVR